VPLHDVKVGGVWCAMCATRITEIVFFPETINSYQYVTQILTPFSEHLSYHKRTFSAKQCNKPHSKQFCAFNVFNGESGGGGRRDIRRRKQRRPCDLQLNAKQCLQGA